MESLSDNSKNILQNCFGSGAKNVNSINSKKVEEKSFHFANNLFNYINLINDFFAFLHCSGNNYIVTHKLKHIYDADRCGFWGMFEQKSTDLYICVENFNLTILQLMCATNCKLIVKFKTWLDLLESCRCSKTDIASNYKCRAQFTHGVDEQFEIFNFTINYNRSFRFRVHNLFKMHT